MEEGIEEINDDEKSKVKKKEQKQKGMWSHCYRKKKPIMFNKNKVLITNPATIPY